METYMLTIIMLINGYKRFTFDSNSMITVKDGKEQKNKCVKQANEHIYQRRKPFFLLIQRT